MILAQVREKVILGQPEVVPMRREIFGQSEEKNEGSEQKQSENTGTVCLVKMPLVEVPHPTGTRKHRRATVKEARCQHVKVVDTRRQL